nr:CDP-alcohol phosphatidyltransferase family protein [Chloroflexia bacterium]
MANLITVGRLLLLFIVVGMIYRNPDGLALHSIVLIGVVFAGDGLDGYVARRRGSTSPFGAVFDIAGDRVVETVLWIIFADLDLIPIWVPLLVVTRGSIVDALRSLSYAEGMTAFGEKNMMRSALTRWLTAGRFMRGLY